MGVQAMVKHAMANMRTNNRSNPSTANVWARRVTEIAADLERSADTARGDQLEQIVANVAAEFRDDDAATTPAVFLRRQQALQEAEALLDPFMAPPVDRETVLREAVQQDVAKLDINLHNVWDIYPRLLMRIQDILPSKQSLDAGVLSSDIMAARAPLAELQVVMTQVKDKILNLQELGHNSEGQLNGSMGGPSDLYSFMKEVIQEQIQKLGPNLHDLCESSLTLMQVLRDILPGRKSLKKGRVSAEILTASDSFSDLQVAIDAVNRKILNLCHIVDPGGVVTMYYMENPDAEPLYHHCSITETVGELVYKAFPPDDEVDGEDDSVVPDLWINSTSQSRRILRNLANNPNNPRPWLQWEHQQQSFKISRMSHAEIAPRRWNLHIVMKKGDYIVAIVHENGVERAKPIGMPKKRTKLTSEHVMELFPDRKVAKILDLVTGNDCSQKPFNKLQYAPLTNPLYIELEKAEESISSSLPSTTQLQSDDLDTSSVYSTPTAFAPDLTGQVSKSSRRPIFTGTYSNVYPGLYATHKVAIKVLRMVNDSKRITERKFQRELFIWWQLRHPNVLPLYGYLEDEDGSDFPRALVSEWAEYGDAHRYLQFDLAWNQRLNLLLDAARGLHYLHDFDPCVVHGDLKPLNVLVDKDGVGRLCDFGLARIVADGLDSGFTTTSAFTGTTRYLSHELVKYTGKAVPTTSTDVYALGCLAHEFIYRLPPHDTLGQNLWEIMRAISQGVPPATRPKNLSQDLSTLWDLLEECWSMDCNERPTAEYFCHYLEHNVQILADAFSFAHEYPSGSDAYITADGP